MPRKKRTRLFGVYLSIEKLNLMDAKEITPMEAIFLSEIDATFSHVYQNLLDTDPHSLECKLTKKYGVWIMAKALAERYRISVRRIEKLLQNLDDKGYLIRSIVKQRNGYHRRYLKTVWTDEIIERSRKFRPRK